MRSAGRGLDGEFPDRKRRFFVTLVLVATIFLAYFPVFDSEFLSLDDGLYVTANPRVLAGISWSGTRWAFTAIDAGYWHPVTWLSYMLDIQLFGQNPHWFHFMNVLFHVVNSVLLMIVLTHMTGAFWQSVVVSFIFAVHPLHVESVAWIAERKDVLFTFFWMLTMGAYLGFVRRKNTGRYLAVLSLFSLSLMAKPMAVTLPFVLLLLDFWPLGRFQSRERRSEDGAVTKAFAGSPAPMGRLIREKVPLLLLSAISSGVAFVAQNQAHAVKSTASFPLSSRLANAAVSYVAYVGDTLWPRYLAVIYPHPRHGIPGWQAVGAGLLLLGITLAVLVAARKRPFLPVGWAWFLGTLVPVIGLVQIGLQSRADRFAYVPQIGLGLMVVWGISGRGAAGRWRRTMLAPASALVILSLMVWTHIQAGYWHDDDTLLGHTIGATSENWLAHRHLALSLEQRGRRSDAMAHWREVLRIKPDFVKSHAAFGLGLAEGGRAGAFLPGEQPVANERAMQEYSSGSALRDQGRLDEAVAAFQRAITSSPGFASAKFNLANVLARRGQFDEAVDQYREVLKITPKDGLALHNLAGVLKMQGRLRESIQYYREAVDVLPRNADIHANLGRALFELGERKKALAEYRQAGRINQRFTADMLQLADSLRAQGNDDEARRWYREALDLNPNDATVKAKLEKSR